MNKYPKPEEKKFVQFIFKWTGNRVPENIIFPNGKKVKIDYMRNGKILFDDGIDGKYTRTYDNNETNERTIIVEYEE